MTKPPVPLAIADRKSVDPSGNINAGKSYVIFGKTDTDAIDLANLGRNSKYAIDYLGDENANTLTGTNSDELFVLMQRYCRH
jgi:hypothetical protein